MPRVVLWVDNVTAPATAKILEAFQQAVCLGGERGMTVTGDRAFPSSVILWDGGDRAAAQDDRPRAEDWIVPLTLSVPSTLEFPGQAVYAACRAGVGLRDQVAQWGYFTGEGDLCLPIVLTTKGPLYAEVLGPKTLGGRPRGTVAMETEFRQPVHLEDALRQPLYGLSHRLLRSLEAPPGVYLVQFGLQGQDIVFDRVLPFPDERAIASIGVQNPNLFACHWRCITHQPIHDLSILDASL